MKRLRSITGVLSMLALPIGLFVYLFLPPFGLRAEQDRIVAAIHAFRDQHGRLPNSLQEAGIEFDRNMFDDVRYWRFDHEPNVYHLTCDKYYWPSPRIHYWYYSSDRNIWEHHEEGF